MADFRLEIKSGIKTIDIEKDGQVLKTVKIDVGNIDTLKNMLSEFRKLEDVKLSAGEELDELVEIERKIINATVGDFDMFWEASNHNPLTLLATLKSLSDWLKDQLEELYTSYV